MKTIESNTYYPRWMAIHVPWSGEGEATKASQGAKWLITLPEGSFWVTGSALDVKDEVRKYYAGSPELPGGKGHRTHPERVILFSRVEGGTESGPPLPWKWSDDRNPEVTTETTP